MGHEPSGGWRNPAAREPVRDQAAWFNGFADAEEEVLPGQLPWPFGPVDLTLKLDDHLRKPFL